LGWRRIGIVEDGVGGLRDAAVLKGVSAVLDVIAVIRLGRRDRPGDGGGDRVAGGVG
jgi:hypothetical protein